MDPDQDFFQSINGPLAEWTPTHYVLAKRIWQALDSDKRQLEECDTELKTAEVRELFPGAPDGGNSIGLLLLPLMRVRLVHEFTDGTEQECQIMSKVTQDLGDDTRVTITVYPRTLDQFVQAIPASAAAN